MCGIILVYNYLDFLTTEDITKVINGGVKHSLTKRSYDNNLVSLLKPGHSHFLEFATDLILLYSTHASLRETRDEASEIKQTRPSTGHGDVSLSNFAGMQVAKAQHADFANSGGAASCECQRSISDVRPVVEGGPWRHGATCVGTGERLVALEAMRYLLAKGAAVNARNQQGQTPLHAAAQGRYPIKLSDGELLGY